ncbi:MAG: hypothetical protein PHS53_05260 [Candidatus Pacebacteria bacterium]|nr:hypothetical protein [Candidatus Paceibacterota bacterium]
MFTKLKKLAFAKLDRLDRRACCSFPILRLRLWWCRLWIREDEFHPSLDFDHEIIISLDSLGAKRYFDDIGQRRRIAHERDLERGDKLLTRR